MLPSLIEKHIEISEINNRNQLEYPKPIHQTPIPKSRIHPTILNTPLPTKPTPLLGLKCVAGFDFRHIYVRQTRPINGIDFNYKLRKPSNIFRPWYK